MKTIYINGRFLSQKVTGVQRYALEIVGAIDMMIGTNQISREKYKFVILVPGNFNSDVAYKNIRIKKTLFTGHFWEQVVLPMITPFKLLLNFCNLGPVLKRNQYVVVHDASIYSVPKGYSLFFRIYYKTLLPLIGLTARGVITDSEFSKRELIKFCKYNENKVKVIFAGSNDFSVKKIDDSILDKLNLTSKGYLFAVGSMNPNKNFGALLEAIKLLNLENRKFVISGGINSKIFQSQAVEGIPESVIFTGYVSDDELNSLYANALCFVFPSIYEGFGFPPLEAMSVGCPVIVSDAASLPEVCSDAALYCNPYDVSDMASKIQFMIDSPKLQAIYSNKGYARVKDLDWKSTVAEVIKLL